jgi:hypothetical protein
MDHRRLRGPANVCEGCHRENKLVVATRCAASNRLSDNLSIDMVINSWSLRQPTKKFKLIYRFFNYIGSHLYSALEKQSIIKK